MFFKNASVLKDKNLSILENRSAKKLFIGEAVHKAQHLRFCLINCSSQVFREGTGSEDQNFWLSDVLSVRNFVFK